jgi:hypothetical protein
MSRSEMMPALSRSRADSRLYCSDGRQSGVEYIGELFLVSTDREEPSRRSIRVPCVCVECLKAEITVWSNTSLQVARVMHGYGTFYSSSSRFARENKTA